MKRIVALLLFVAVLLPLTAQQKAPAIVAHRGYHQEGGAAKNSIEALKMAQKERFEMVEFDVNMSSDGELLILHGPWHPNAKAENRMRAQFAKADEVRNIALTNGEKVPTLEEWIAQAAKCKQTKMLIEIKGHSTPALDTEVVEKVQAVLKKHKMQNQVSYLVNHEFLVRELVRLTPKGTPIVLSLGSYSPAYCHALGCTLSGYTYQAWRKNPHYIDEARSLGMKLMAWTVNNPDHIKWLIKEGFDYILTDDPVMMRETLKQLGK